MGGIKSIPWRRKWQPTPVFLPGKSHKQKILVDYSPWDRKESEMTEHAHMCAHTDTHHTHTHTHTDRHTQTDTHIHTHTFCNHLVLALIDW